MRFLIRLSLASGLLLLIVQNATEAAGRQNSSHAKEAPAASPTVTDSTKPNSTVGPTQPVITVRGICAEDAQKGAHNKSSCSTVITREQFENLQAVLNPEGQIISSAGRQNLARSYAEFLAYEKAARTSGLENTPQFRSLMNWVRLRTIADFYRRDLQARYRTPSQEEIEAYYKQHVADFETVKLARVLVPREGPTAADKPEFEKKASEAANTAHDRAAKGDDPTQIQKDAYASLGLAAPPGTDMGTFRRANLTEKEAAQVFALQPGGVSEMQTEPRSYVVYKVISKDTLPLDQVKSEISREISQQKFKDTTKAATDAAPAEFNEQYFGPEILKPATKAPALPPREPAR